MTEGKGLRQICEAQDMPSRTTVLRWLEANASFRDRYARARTACMDWYAEEILRIAFDDSGDLIIDGERVVAGHHVVQRAKLKVDTLKWIMAKLAPQRYGEKPGQDDNEPKHLTISWEVERTIVRPDGQKPPDRYEPPRQIPYRKPELPGDLTEADWSVMLATLELIKRTIPSDSDSPPAEVFEVMRKALFAHFREPVQSKEIDG
jgi:hypothetical protein